MNLSPVLDQLASAAAACAEAVRSGAVSCDDAALLETQRALAASARLVEVAAAAVSAQIEHRSRPELGHDGLAQRLGARTPARLVQTLTGVSGSTARRMVRVGTLLAAHDAGLADPSARHAAEAWLAPVAAAVARGAISAEAVDVIRLGLGQPTDTVPVDALAGAATALVELAASITLEQLAARAREARDNLDTAGVEQREAERRDRRYLHLTLLPDGMTRVSGLLDPESAAVVVSAIDAATSPRRGGPRFVDPADAARAAAIAVDSRSTEQLALDSLVELVDVAVRSHSNGVLGARRADVRLLVSERDLAARSGVGFIEGQTASVSIATVERHICAGGFVPVVFDDEGQSLNVGQTQRFHTARQRAAIATRDGGCVATDCDRPPSWCEVHHINEFSRGGETSVADGVLMCRHHHLEAHNNQKRVVRHGSKYWLEPPPGAVNREHTRLHTKSAAVRRLLTTA